MLQMTTVAEGGRHAAKCRIIAGALITALVLLGSPTCSEGGVAGPKSATLTAADKAFSALDYDGAEKLYAELIGEAPSNAALCWKIARLNIAIAESFGKKETARRMPYYNKAVEYGKKAVELDPRSAEAHTWYAAALAVKADKIGAKEKLNRAAEIKRELDRAVELNPNNDVAWSLLGSYYRQLSKIGWVKRLIGGTFVGKVPKGNPQAAEQALKKAISLNPRVIRHYHELGLLYLDLDRRQEALQALQTALRKPVLMKSDRRRLDEIRALVRKLSE